MQRIPLRSRLAAAATSRRVDTEPLNEAVRDRLMVGDQQRFPESNPDVVYNQEPAEKIS